MFFKKSNSWFVATATDVGTVREINQDNIYMMEHIQNHEKLVHFSMSKTVKKQLLCAVCDGMGGGAMGEEASYIAVKCLEDLDVRPWETMAEDVLEQEVGALIQRINDLIYDRFRDGAGFTGCTIVMLYADKNKTMVVNVGDSPCIFVSGDVYNVVSVSDNRANQLYYMGKITEKERWTHKSKSQLTQYLGMNPQEILVSPHFSWKGNMNQNECYVLSSDGLVDGVEFEELVEKVATVSKREIAEVLVHAAMDNGSRDNVTAIVIAKEK